MSKNVGGQPPKLTSRESTKVVRYLTVGEAESTSHAAQLLHQDTGKKVSRWTVQRALRKANVRAIEKKEKPLLSKKNVKARLEFEKRYQSWTEDEWKQVIFSDETKINRFQTDGQSWTWKRTGESMQAKDHKQTVKHGGGNIKVWGCFTSYGPGPLHRIEGNMNREMYLAILQQYLCGTVSNMPHPSHEVVFQHDNDPKHTAKCVQAWLATQEFQLLQWPAQSPDQNPIENLWSYLKRALLHDYSSPPSNVNVLWERVQEQWEKLSPDYCATLVRSMPNRLAALRKAKGLWTKY